MPGPITLPHPSRDELTVTSVLAALSDPERLAIVRQLADGPLEMAQCFMSAPEMPKSTRSHLMKVLREAGVVQNDPAPQGPGRVIHLRRADLDARFPGLLDSVLAST
jgi:DNA-binding transcriptional ArsR family regulator